MPVGAEHSTRYLLNEWTYESAQPNPKTTPWLWKVKGRLPNQSLACSRLVTRQPEKWATPGGGTLRPRDGRGEARLRLPTLPSRRTQAGASEDCVLTLPEPPNPFLAR